MLSKYTTAHIILIFVQISFSIWHIIASITLKNVDPFIFALTRESFASFLLIVLVTKIFSLDFFQFTILNQTEKKNIVFLGFFSFVNVLSAVFSLFFISPTIFAIFQTLIPIITTFFSILFKYDKFTLKKLISIVFSVTGAIISINYKSSSSSTVIEVIYTIPSSNISLSSFTIGYSLLICQIFAMSMIYIFSKPLLLKLSPLLLTTYYYSIGTIITFIFFFFLIILGKNNPSDIFQFFFLYDSSTKFALLYCVFFATIFSYVMLQFSNRELSPSISSIYCTIQPISTSILSYFFLSISLTKEQAFGGLLVFLGLYLSLDFSSPNKNLIILDKSNSDFP